MRSWKTIFAAVFMSTMIFLYLDDKRYADKVRPRGFSTDAPEGSVFVVRLRERLELRRVRVGQMIHFVPAESKPYGSVNDAMLPADAVLDARVKQILSGPRGRCVVVFEFKRLRAGGRTVPISAFLIVKDAAQHEAENSIHERYGSAGAFIARSIQDDPLTVLSGYLSGTYFAGFLSRHTEAPPSFISNESGQSVSPSIRLMVRLHRRAFIPR